MSVSLERFSSVPSTVTFATTEAAAEALDIRGASAIGIVLPSTSLVTAFTVYAAATESATFVAAYDTAQALMGPYTVSASKAYSVPVDVFPFPYVKFVATFSSGTTEAVTVTLKG